MLSLAAVTSLAQSQRIDSLKSLLGETSGLERGQLFYQLAIEYVDVDNRVAMNYVNNAIPLVVSSGDSLWIVKSGRVKSQLYRRLDEIDSSETISNEILPIAERNNYADETKKLLNGIALVYLYKAKYDKALNTYLRILDSSDPTKNKQEYRVALNNVGLVYFKLDDLDKALTYFNNALALMDDPADEVEIQLVLMNMGLCHVYKDNYTLAEEYTNRAFSYCNDGSCSLLLRGKLYFNMGLIAQGRKQWTLAEEYYLRSHQMVKETGDELYEVDNLIRLFQIYIETNNIAAAKSHLREAEAILSGHTYYVKGIMELYAELAKVYQRLGNIHQVATYQAKYITLRDSVYNEGLTKNLMKVEAEYLERENRHKLEAQAKILELSNDVITRQRAVNIFIGIVAVLSFAIALVLTQNVKQKRHANELLEQKVKERTTQLEANHLNLLKSLEERNQQVKRIASEIRSSMATIKGLCQLSLQDGSVIERGQYITKIETASNMLESGIYRTLGVSESTES